MKKWLAISLVALAGALAIAIGCARDDNGADQAALVDTELMAFLSEARALHHQANLKEESGDLPGAISSMQRLASARTPHPERKTPEVEEVLADAHARLAELELKRGSLALASRSIENGLLHAPDATYFRGHLIEVQGLVMEATASGLADAGNSAEAARAREKAVQLLEEVVRIQDQVIQRSLGHDGGSR